MKIKCSRCDAFMDNTKYHKKENALECASCGQLLRMEVITGAKARSAIERGARVEVPLPKGITLARTDTALILRRRWFQKSHLILLLFTLLWDSAGAVWLISTLTLTSSTLLQLISPALHLLTGALLTWYTLATLFNTTSLTVSKDSARVTHSPFMWFGNFTIQSSEIGQLWSQKMEKRPGDVLFHLLGESRSGNRFTLLYGLENPAQALYIEQEIEKYLHIRDRRMKGEL